jgi:dsDNA-specific endonuclease/ATPase MutS2
VAIADRRQIGAREASRSDAIDALYSELRQLLATSIVDPSENPEIKSRFAQLRALQSEEAEAMRKRLDERLHLKPGAGYQALEEARRLLAEHANSAPEDLPSSR